MDPYKRLVDVLDMRMINHAGSAVDGISAELGTITSSGLKLDAFKHELQSYFMADWLVKLHFPAFSLIGTMTAPVDAQGNSIGGATSERTRFDFAEAQIDEVKLDWKAGLRSGDRVLAVPIHKGRDAVILCKVVR